MGWRMENFNILGVHGKNRVLLGVEWGGVHEKEGAGVDTPMHTMVRKQFSIEVMPQFHKTYPT